MAITVYKSTDTDAPVLTKEAGTLKTVLKGCLVTGYGSTAAKGWTAAFEDTNKIALKSAATSSTKCVLRVDDSRTDGRTLLAAYHTMTDINSGNGLFSEPNHSIVKSYSNPTTQARPWVVIADEKRFYLFINYKDGYSNDALFFGDFTSYLPTDNFNCLIMTDDSTSTYLRSPFIRSGEHNCAADASQLNKKTRAYLSSIDDVPSNGAQSWVYPSTINNGFCLFPAYIRENYAGSYDYRGVVPGLYYTPFNVEGSIADYTVLDNVAGVPAGQRVMIVHSSIGANSSPLTIGINIDEWQ